MIELKEVSYKYDNAPEHALSGVDLRIDDGEFIAIVGRNGSGKSTLAKLLNGLLLPEKGEVCVNGMRTDDESRLLDIRRSVGIVFQNPDNQLVTSIVEEDVGFGPENLGIPTAEILRRVHSSLETVGMLDYARSAPHMLSGGQKQRVAIAGMLAMEPSTLVLDEATAMLDPVGRREILDVVSRLNKEKNITVVMITQYMEETVSADRIIVMNHGRIDFEGTPRSVFSRGERLCELGLDVPIMVELRNELAKRSLIDECGALTIEEMADVLCPLLLKI